MIKMLRVTKSIFSPAALFIRHYQVTVLGAATEIGQSVSLLLTAHPSITKLVLHDSLPKTPGVILDMSHVPTGPQIDGYTGEDSIEMALQGSDIVIAAGGLILRPGVSKSKCIAANVDFIKKSAAAIARLKTTPFIGIVTEPINSIVPVAAEVMRHHGQYNEKKLFGITIVDLLRARCLYAIELQQNASNCFIPVIGGHSEQTMIPLPSQAKPGRGLNMRQIQEFIAKVRNGEENISKSKRGISPTLSVAYSVQAFVRGVLNALDGYPSTVNAYVENNDFGTSFFSGIVNLTKEGLGDMRKYENLLDYECQLLERALYEIKCDVSRGRRALEGVPLDFE